MDMTFNCPHCNQMLEVDSSATGSQIECPACNQAFAVPALPAAESVPAAAAPTDTKPHKQFSVPVRETPAESLIQKPHIPLEAAAKSSVCESPEHRSAGFDVIRLNPGSDLRSSIA